MSNLFFKLSLNIFQSYILSYIYFAYISVEFKGVSPLFQRDPFKAQFFSFQLLKPHKMNRCSAIKETISCEAHFDTVLVWCKRNVCTSVAWYEWQ